MLHLSHNRNTTKALPVCVNGPQCLQPPELWHHQQFDDIVIKKTPGTYMLRTQYIQSDLSMSSCAGEYVYI